MQIPDLPTDNLYKFAATFGFLAFVLSLSYAFIKLEEFSIAAARGQALTETHGELADLNSSKIDLRSEQLTSAVTSLERTVDMKLAEPEIDRAAFADLLAELSKQRELMYQAANGAIDEQKDLVDRFGAVTEAVALSKSAGGLLRVLVPSLFLTAFLSLAASLWGFRGWYTQVQRHQDEILRKESGL